MADELDVGRCFESASKELGSVQILVNNAGIGKSAPFHRMETNLWNEIIGLNLTGTYLCTKQVFSEMRESGYGRIVNISSTVGLRGYPYIAAYCASKHGVIGLTRTLALECVKKGITVNAICPGMTKTDMLEGIISERSVGDNQTPDQVENDMAKHIYIIMFFSCIVSHIHCISNSKTIASILCQKNFHESVPFCSDSDARVLDNTFGNTSAKVPVVIAPAANLSRKTTPTITHP